MADTAVLYEGYDIMAEWAAGLLTTPINVMYLEFENGEGSGSGPTAIDLGDGKTYYDALPANRDYIRVPILIRPAPEASGSNYAGNKPVFSAMTGASEGVTKQLPFTAAAVSRVVGVALVVAPAIDDNTQDRVFARGYFEDTPIYKTDDNQCAVQWTHTFEAE